MSKNSRSRQRHVVAARFTLWQRIRAWLGLRPRLDITLSASSSPLQDSGNHVNVGGTVLSKETLVRRHLAEVQNKLRHAKPLTPVERALLKKFLSKDREAKP